MDSKDKMRKNPRTSGGKFKCDTTNECDLKVCGELNQSTSTNSSDFFYAKTTVALTKILLPKFWETSWFTVADFAWFAVPEKFFDDGGIVSEQIKF